MSVLNRTMRRQQERQSTKKSQHTQIYTIDKQRAISLLEEHTKEQLAKERQAAYNDAAEVICSAMVIALHDLYGFGTARLKRVIDHIQNTTKCLDPDRVMPEDLKQLAEELGVVIR